MRSIEIPATLSRHLNKASDQWEVGGLASDFLRDLDGEAITPEAVRQAIPEFMAQRGADGIQGGPLRLHHNFWDRFLRQAIDTLRLPRDIQLDLVAAIALPLGRVTEIWVDHKGATHWKGVLSQANPIARIIWQLLREKLIHLGVSLGGKILNTRLGRDGLGRACTLIDAIRLDEISITDNPALRLTQGEGTGAYIQALAKSVRSAFPIASTPMKRNTQRQLDRFLRKAIGEGLTLGMDTPIVPPEGKAKRGTTTVSMDATSLTTGMGGKSQRQIAPKGSGNEPATDVWGMTVEQLTRELSKACDCKKTVKDWSDPDLLKTLTDGAYGLTTLTDNPPSALVNFVRFLQYFSRFAQSLPLMDNYQAEGTIAAMPDELLKAIEDFQEQMPTDLMQQTFRSPGSNPIDRMDIMFPQQYVI